MKRVFLSYSRKDLKFVEKLAEDLQLAGYDVWYDLTDLEGGDRWANEIQAGIDQCDAFITVISPNAMASAWVEKEFLYASNAGKNIVPVMYEESKLPIWLLDIHFIDIRGRSYKKKFPLILAAIEDAEEPVVLPTPAKGLTMLNPLWIGGIAGGIVLVLSAIFGLRALLAGSRDAPEVIWTPTELVSLSTSTLVLATETHTPFPTFTLTLEPNTEVAPTPTPASVITDSSGAEMLLVPASSFTMGSEAGSSDERPIHVVGLDAYYIDTYEVSNARYKECVDELICSLPTNTRNYTNARLSAYPVTYVTWEMAKAFCEWRGARLPTEAEWEKAARGTNLLEYPWGNRFNGKLVNFCDANCPDGRGAAGFDDGYVELAPVDAFEDGKSPYGVYNMAGNVREFVADWYDAGYYSVSPNRNPTGPERGSYRVLRGGSWYDNMDNVRTVSRTFLSPASAYNYVGFRCAESVAP